jgi:hypothetical protein
MALQELMNPAPIMSSTLKRKAFNEFTPLIVADDLYELTSLEADVALEHAGQIKYHRASQINGECAPARTRRVVRMRRSHSAVRRSSLEQGQESDQIEKDGHLLLNLSQSRPTTVR